MRLLTRFLVGTALTGAGALALHEAWWPAAGGYAAVCAGLVLIVVAIWGWLERDLWRRVRSSDEHRARVLSWAGQPKARAEEVPAPVRIADDGNVQPAAVEHVAAGATGGLDHE
jgi:hypothetical protein